MAVPKSYLAAAEAPRLSNHNTAAPYAECPGVSAGGYLHRIAVVELLDFPLIDPHFSDCHL